MAVYFLVDIIPETSVEKETSMISVAVDCVSENRPSSNQFFDNFGQLTGMASGA